MIAGEGRKPMDRMGRMAQRSTDHVSADEEDGYRAQVARYPRLSSDEEAQLLATRGASRDQANQRLIEHNLYLVYEAARARKSSGVSFGDLFQQGNAPRDASDMPAKQHWNCQNLSASVMSTTTHGSENYVLAFFASQRSMLDRLTATSRDL